MTLKVLRSYLTKHLGKFSIIGGQSKKLQVVHPLKVNMTWLNYMLKIMVAH